MLACVLNDFGDPLFARVVGRQGERGAAAATADEPSFVQEAQAFDGQFFQLGHGNSSIRETGRGLVRAWACMVCTSRVSVCNHSGKSPNGVTSQECGGVGRHAVLRFCLASSVVSWRSDPSFTSSIARSKIESA